MIFVEAKRFLLSAIVQGIVIIINTSNVYSERKVFKFLSKTMGLQSAYNNETDIKGNSQKFSNSTILCCVPPLSAAGQPGVYWRGVVCLRV